MESKYQNSLINNIKESTFQKVVNTFYNNCKFGGRYQSWEHCKNFFDNNKFPIEDFYKADLTLEDWKNKEKEIEKDECNKNKLDSMCLHLAFYLASWGMYRGSAFILQYDYRKHKKAVLTLLQGKYEHLWIVNTDSQDSEDKFFQNQDKIELIFGNKKQKKFGLINELKECYKGNGEYEDDEPTHTLITKIIMGTMGCIPAFDRYLEAGLKKEGISSKLNEDTYETLCNLCHINNEMFKELKDKGFNYDYIVVDQFAKPYVYYNYLKSSNNVVKNITFITKAEDKCLSVACASLISRYIFLKEFAKLGEQLGMFLLKGASDKVDEQGIQIVKKYGFDKLSEISKLNFKNTEKIKVKLEN